MPKELIYAVEDETHIQQLIKYNLEAAGYRASAFDSGESMLKECERTLPDLFILDIMLPGIDGFDICKKLRQDNRTRGIPIIMLTAKSDELEKILGLELGADDYITKPFSVRELIARVKVLFRRIGNTEVRNNGVIKVGNLTIDCTSHEVYKGDVLIEMPLKEFELLKMLVSNKGRVLSRDLLLEKVWGIDFFGETRTVDVHIRYLRQKIEDDDSNPTYIETVRGIGYKFRDRAFD